MNAPAARRSPDQMRADAVAIWRAGLEGVRSERLVAEALEVRGDQLRIGDEPLPLKEIGRIVVVGGGKAGGGMAAAVERQFGPSLLRRHRVDGWVNVPADCVRPLQRITLHPGRAAGSNEPTAAGVEGTERILELVASLGPEDLCLCLISGGGSALLPAPREGVSLADKSAVTRFLSGAGCPIEQLNTVRAHLSRIKGGGLARHCTAGRLVSLIISDVIGDPLAAIASGPTVPREDTPADALRVLERFSARQAGIPRAVFDILEKSAATDPISERPLTCRVTNLVIGNNARAVDAAGGEAERRGYSFAMWSATAAEGAAEEVGRQHARQALRMRLGGGPDCLITGGEPVVTLVDAGVRGRGGRNQQLVLAAADCLTAEQGGEGIVLLSAGTDGEDGPTDAAGAWIDAEALRAAERLRLDRAEHLRRNDAYTYLEQVGTLIKTGPTHTNVCDLRVVLVDRIEAS